VRLQAQKISVPIVRAFSCLHTGPEICDAPAMLKPLPSFIGISVVLGLGCAVRSLPRPRLPKLTGQTSSSSSPTTWGFRTLAVTAGKSRRRTSTPGGQRAALHSVLQHRPLLADPLEPSDGLLRPANRHGPPKGKLPSWTRVLPHYLKPLAIAAITRVKWHLMGAPRSVADGGFDHSYPV